MSNKIDSIMNSVTLRIRSGSLRAGDKLSSVRQEAALHGVAKNTVVEAYLRLIGQGIVTARPGSGFYVAGTHVQSSRPSLPNVSGTVQRAALLTEQLERRLPVRPGDGSLPPDWLDPTELRRPIALPRAALSDSYNSAGGFLPLRERLCATLFERGIDCDADQVCLTYGGNHALDLIIRRYVSSGDSVLVDEPGYYPLLWKLALAGAKIVGVRRHHGGPDLDELAEKAASSGAKLFFTQSLAHNPMGGSMTSGNAYGVLRIAEAANLVLVEDDPFADLLPAEAPRLAALDQLKRVIYVGSFSKTLPGSFRVGYVAASAEVASDLNELKAITMITTSGQNERVVHSLIEDARYLKYLRRLRERISEATLNTANALENIGYAVARPFGGGFYVWIDLPSHTNTSELAVDAAKRGIFIAPSDAFLVSGTQVPGMRVNIAYGTDKVFMDWLAGLRTKVPPN